MKYGWEVQRRQYGLWVHTDGQDPAGREESDADPVSFVRSLGARLRPAGEWRIIAWDGLTPGPPASAAVQGRACVSCGAAVQRAFTIDGQPQMLDLESSPDGDAVLIGRLDSEPTMLYGVDPAGETMPWGTTIARSAPRYRQHDCAQGQARS